MHNTSKNATSDNRWPEPEAVYAQFRGRVRALEQEAAATADLHVEYDHDYRVENHGSLFLVRPFTVRASHWLRDNVSDESQWFGGALVVEPRFVADLLWGMEQEGLVRQ